MIESSRMRARAMGVAPGIFHPGALNAITDVPGVRVGHLTRVDGARVRTGITAVVPHGGDLYADRVPAALHVGNGFGKLVGATQLQELGEAETPILLTSTLNVWRVADALVGWLLEQPGMRRVRSLNPVVAETNDGILNDARARPLGMEEVRAALANAAAGAVEEGSVGGGTGNIAFGWKGGIGSSSRVLPQALGGFAVGVLVQANFGGVLQVLGAPVGRALDRYAFREHVDADTGAGSIVMIVATSAPMGERNLRRLAARTMLGLARTGSCAANGSGDYAIAFSTAEEVRRHIGRARHAAVEIDNDAMSPLFQAAVEATEEAIYNALFEATTMTGNGVTVEAIPLDKVREVLAGSGIRVP